MFKKAAMLAALCVLAVVVHTKAYGSINTNELATRRREQERGAASFLGATCLDACAKSQYRGDGGGGWRMMRCRADCYSSQARYYYDRVNTMCILKYIKYSPTWAKCISKGYAKVVRASKLSGDSIISKRNINNLFVVFMAFLFISD